MIGWLRCFFGRHEPVPHHDPELGFYVGCARCPWSVSPGIQPERRVHLHAGGGS